MLGEGASPFIDEGDGLTSERERVRRLLILVAHAGGYRMMVGAHNTIGCQIHMGGGVCLLQVWQTSVPAILLTPRGMQGVSPCSHGTINDGAHNTVNASEARGGALPYGREVAEYCSCRCTGYGPWYRGLTYAP